jgi:hypothetical protein
VLAHCENCVQGGDRGAACGCAGHGALLLESEAPCIRYAPVEGTIVPTLAEPFFDRTASVPAQRERGAGGGAALLPEARTETGAPELLLPHDIDPGDYIAFEEAVHEVDAFSLLPTSYSNSPALGDSPNH